MGTAFQANAQKEGEVWVGGSIGLNSEKVEDGAKFNVFTIAPEFGYGFSDQIGAGIRLGVLTGNYKMDYSGYTYKQNLTGFAIEPFVRYTFLRWNALSVFVDSGLSYQNSKLKDKFDGEKEDLEKNNYFGIFVNPGFSVQLSNTIALKGDVNLISLGFGKDEDLVDEVKVNSTSMGINTPFNTENIRLGFKFRF